MEDLLELVGFLILMVASALAIVVSIVATIGGSVFVVVKVLQWTGVL